MSNWPNLGYRLTYPTISIAFISPETNKHFFPDPCKSANMSSNTVVFPTPGSPVITIFVPGITPFSALKNWSTLVLVRIGVNNLSLNDKSSIFTVLTFSSTVFADWYVFLILFCITLYFITFIYTINIRPLFRFSKLFRGNPRYSARSSRNRIYSFVYVRFGCAPNRG